MLFDPNIESNLGNYLSPSPVCTSELTLDDLVCDDEEIEPLVVSVEDPVDARL